MGGGVLESRAPKQEYHPENLFNDADQLEIGADDR